MRYVVETRVGNTWENVWSEDQWPMTFDTEADAEAEIEDALECMESAYRRGDMSSPMDRDEFRIVPYGVRDSLFALCDEYAAWCEAQGLPCIDAQEHLASIDDPAQRMWLSDFACRWEAAEEEGLTHG